MAATPPGAPFLVPAPASPLVRREGTLGLRRAVEPSRPAARAARSRRLVLFALPARPAGLSRATGAGVQAPPPAEAAPTCGSGAANTRGEPDALNELRRALGSQWETGELDGRAW